ncbi:MAG: hypothetical protein AseanaTS_04760 [Candidatus Pelagadaptatus aseana]|uniref:hypothetical protein n=1 Tax=Candidatus Pelagadaptatus aseana TaxID=3120508 RepID=UPI0039B2B344
MTDSYLMAWAIYLGCSLILIWALWVNTRNIGLLLVRNSLRVTGMVLLLFPYVIGDGETLMAPAIIMFVMEAVFEGAPERVGLPLLGCWLVAMVLGVLASFWSRYKREQNQQLQFLEQQRQEMLHESIHARPERETATN